MDRNEVFVNQENMALFHCPHCGRMKHVSVQQFKSKKHSLQVKCACQQTFRVDLNFRKKFRKQTSLPGFCQKRNGVEQITINGTRKPNCTIVNISMGGLGIRLSHALSLQLGDRLLVDFVLDDKKESRIQRDIIVRHIGENSYIGVEFAEHDLPGYDKIIGFYMMP